MRQRGVAGPFDLPDFVQKVGEALGRPAAVQEQYSDVYEVIVRRRLEG